ncbi:hypothetical protein ACOSQ3_033072 [Xanthoceras sorbifolium]
MSNKINSSLLVGHDSFKEENIEEGVMGPVEGAATGMFHSVKNLDEVDGEAVRVGDIDKRVSISDGLLNGPGQMEFMADNLMEVKVGVVNLEEAQFCLKGSQKKAPKRWKRVARSLT